MAFSILNVAEKNDAAKAISNVLSHGTTSRREGSSKFNKIYEFQYQLFERTCHMIMTSVSGHLMAFEFATGYQAWHSCQPLALFHAPVEKKVPSNMNNLKITLEREVRKSRVLIVWTDCDREGENIGFEVIEVCRKIKPNIDVYRARFSEITAASITRAVNNLIRPDELTSFAVDVRQELDLRIGAAFTRMQTLRLTKLFPEVLRQQLISYGSCQFPTLGFVVERYKEILAFVAETFFKINVKHSNHDGEAEFVWARVRLFHRLACTVLHEACLENPLATVVNQTSKPKSKFRPLPLHTVELEKLASRKLRINAKETMRVAEKLYNQGFISYPRTETNMFPSSLNLTDLIQQHTVDANWGQFATNLLAEGATPRQGTKTDNAHPPIHPTKYTDNLQGNEKRLYEFIVRHFLACCSKDAQGVETTVIIDIAGERFTAKGLIITAKNYLEVYPYDKWCDKSLPVYRTGDTFMPTSIDMVEGQTEPPSLLTEADLIALMEKHGIGTDATHAEHIEKIKSRNYVGVQPDGKFVPGELGMGLVNGYDAMGFEMSKPHLRAELESDLKKICLGEKDKEDVLREHVEIYKNVFVRTCEHVNQLDGALAEFFGNPEELSEDPVAAQVNEPQPVCFCPSCRTQMCLKKTERGFMIGCMRFPDCTYVGYFPSSLLDAQVTQVVCSRCQPRPVYKIKFQFKRGSVPPMVDLEYQTCILCDDYMQEVLRFKIRPGSAPSSANQSNTTERKNTGNNGNRRGGETTSKSSRQPSTSHRSSFNIDTNRQLPRSNPGGGDIVCKCSQPAITRVVQKAGNNKGRQFYTCETRQCNFFQWADDVPANQTNQANDRVGDNRTRTQNAANQNELLCQCGQPAILKTVKKSGPNQHRQFYSCAKPIGQSCGFFKWFDGETSSHQPSNNVELPTKKPRRCGNCRQPGHTRKNCPRK